MPEQQPNPNSLLARLDAMLEFDSLKDESQFSSMIRNIRDHGNIPIDRVVTHLGISERRLQEWVDGINIPDPPFWQPVINKVRSLIDQVLSERDY